MESKFRNGVKGAVHVAIERQYKGEQYDDEVVCILIVLVAL